MTPADRAATLALAAERRITLADLADAPHTCKMVPLTEATLKDHTAGAMAEDALPPPGKVFLSTVLRLVLDHELVVASYEPLEWARNPAMATAAPSAPGPTPEPTATKKRKGTR
jgi:hypothetical protein